MTAKLPDAGALWKPSVRPPKMQLGGQPPVTMPVLNRGWLDLWDSYLDDYLDPPKRFVKESKQLGSGPPKENPMPGGGEERREQAQQAAYGVRLREKPVTYPAEPCAVLHLAPSRPMVLGALAW